MTRAINLLFMASGTLESLSRLVNICSVFVIKREKYVKQRYITNMDIRFKAGVSGGFICLLLGHTPVYVVGYMPVMAIMIIIQKNRPISMVM